MSWVAAKPRIACTASNAAQARAAQAELAARYDLVDPVDCGVIVALGGDGLLLHTIHEHLQLGRPIFGMNRGTVGFLMNEFRPDGLVERVAAATPIIVHPLAMAATYADGSLSHALAFNEVAVTRSSGHSANIRLSIDGVERMARFVGDGLIVATAAGSTAYNLSAHGPIIPLGSNLLAVTPVSPFRPRRWKGALVPTRPRSSWRTSMPTSGHSPRPPTSMSWSTSCRSPSGRTPRPPRSCSSTPTTRSRSGSSPNNS
jgi:NAD+ kinase